MEEIYHRCISIIKILNCFSTKHSNLDIPQKGDSFEKYAATGFDDTFPNIDAEKIIYSGREITYNDHGDIWTIKEMKYAY